jgi:hypothetical protein
MKCLKCRGEIADPKLAFMEVVAYLKPKIERGTSGSSLIEREFTGRAICPGCMTICGATLAVRSRGLRSR